MNLDSHIPDINEHLGTQFIPTYEPMENTFSANLNLVQNEGKRILRQY